MYPIDRGIELASSDGDPFPRGLDQALAELAHVYCLRCAALAAAAARYSRA